MARVSRVLLPFVLTGVVLLSDLSWLESSNKNTTTDNAVGLASASTPTPIPTQKPERSAPASPVAEQKTPDEKSPSIIQMLEGREHDLILWVSIAIIAFAIGWILGGNYYLRRDRARSKRLRF
jgi:hypothetical protein